MKTVDLRVDPEADLSGVVEHLQRGGVIAYPTETVYGFGSACTPEGVAAVRLLKDRQANKPLIVLSPSMDSLDDLEWSAQAREFAEVFWPGALTLVLPDPRGMFPVGVRSSEGTVAVRISPHPTVRRLLSAFGEAITSTSVNLRGAPPARSGSEAEDVIGRLNGDTVWLLNAGTLPESGPSTIVDCTQAIPVVVREGSVPIGRLRCVNTEIHGSQT